MFNYKFHEDMFKFCAFVYSFLIFFDKIEEQNPCFRPFLDLEFADLVFAVFSWNVTPAKSEVRL